jgi:hypothetical protein
MGYAFSQTTGCCTLYLGPSYAIDSCSRLVLFVHAQRDTRSWAQLTAPTINSKITCRPCTRTIPHQHGVYALLAMILTSLTTDDEFLLSWMGPFYPHWSQCRFHIIHRTLNDLGTKCVIVRDVFASMANQCSVYGGIRMAVRLDR